MWGTAVASARPVLGLTALLPKSNTSRESLTGNTNAKNNFRVAVGLNLSCADLICELSVSCFHLSTAGRIYQGSVLRCSFHKWAAWEMLIDEKKAERMC